jgi:hypothetical protein
VASEADGDFIVVWESKDTSLYGGQDGSSFGAFARRFTSAGAPVTSDIQLNSYTTSSQNRPAVAIRSDGFAVAWNSNGQDGSLGGVFARRLAPAAILDVDGNGVLGGLTDGLLVFRRLSGFTGTTLVNGVVGAGCTRCDATSISNYITGLGLVLDIDGNGVLGGLTDGLLVFRYLLGFLGTALVKDVVGGGCTRCDAAAIEGYLATLI